MTVREGMAVAIDGEIFQHAYIEPSTLTAKSI